MLNGAIDVPHGADMFPNTVVVAVLCASCGGHVPIIAPAARRSIRQLQNVGVPPAVLARTRQKTPECRDTQRDKRKKT